MIFNIMNLIIVESPTKSKTIKKFLDSGYDVVACFGHVRDLPKKELGIEIKNNFEPKYEIVSRARKILRELKDKTKTAERIYLATDYDREGEAIAWHLVKAGGFDEGKTKNEKVKRITFHEITKPAIIEALKHPRDIDLHLVDAQQARRILDRLVGYKLSPFLWRKVAQGLSAGRVQSVATRLVVEREREIEKFTPKEYWQIEAQLAKEKKVFKAVLIKIDERAIEKLAIESEKMAQKYLEDLKDAVWQVSTVETEEKKRYPSPPFTTSTLQQEAAGKLSFSPRQTMRLAQRVYEQGLITYMRTDSVHVSSQALEGARKVITQEFGKDYALAKPRFFKTRTKGAQEAHEAIRPTNLKNLPSKVNLDLQEAKLYELIWKKMLASQMKEAEVLETKIEIKANNLTFKATGSQIKFAGFLKVYHQDTLAENLLPELQRGDKLKLIELEKKQYFTEPPPRYSEATLIRELEKRGIGRPSTYAPTLSVIIERGYIEKSQGKLMPLDIGCIVNDVLVKHFPKIVDFDFTAKMEEELDEIAEGKLKWQEVLTDFYGPFAENLERKTKEVSKEEITEEESDEVCPECGKALKIKLGRFGKFLACSGFPECKYTRPMIDKTNHAKEDKAITAKIAEEKCPKCEKNMVLKEGKFGAFLACSGYPGCKFTKNIEIVAKVPCPSCGGKILRKTTRKGKTFWGCGNFPKCKTAFWDEPVSKECPKCHKTMVQGKNMIKCSQCEWKQMPNENHS